MTNMFIINFPSRCCESGWTSGECWFSFQVVISEISTLTRIKNTYLALQIIVLTQFYLLNLLHQTVLTITSETYKFSLVRAPGRASSRYQSNFHEFIFSRATKSNELVRDRIQSRVLCISPWTAHQTIIHTLFPQFPDQRGWRILPSWPAAVGPSLLPIVGLIKTTIPRQKNTKLSAHSTLSTTVPLTTIVTLCNEYCWYEAATM